MDCARRPCAVRPAQSAGERRTSPPRSAPPHRANLTADIRRPTSCAPLESRHARGAPSALRWRAEPRGAPGGAYRPKSRGPDQTSSIGRGRARDRLADNTSRGRRTVVTPLTPALKARLRASGRTTQKPRAESDTSASTIFAGRPRKILSAAASTSAASPRFSAGRRPRWRKLQPATSPPRRSAWPWSSAYAGTPPERKL